MNLDYLIRKREGLHDQATELLAKAATDERALSADELKTHKALIEQIGTIDATLAARDAQVAAEVATARPAQTARMAVPGARDTAAVALTRADVLKSDEYRAAFQAWMRSGNREELRAHTVATDTSGGYFVPDDFYNGIVLKLREFNVIRPLATVITTTTGLLKIPVETSAGSAAWTAESAAYNESEDVIGEISLDAHKASRIVKVSEELAQDSAFNLEAFLAARFAESFADLEEDAFVDGDGSNKPRGFLTDSTVGTTATATNAITFDELTDLFHSVKPAYRQRAVWVMNDATIKYLAKIKTGVASDNRYLWRESLAAGDPMQLFGRPVVACNQMPTIATGQKPVAFGDFSYFWIGQRSSMPLIRLNERYRELGLIGFASNLRVDSELTQAEAIKHLVQA